MRMPSIGTIVTLFLLLQLISTGQSQEQFHCQLGPSFKQQIDNDLAPFHAGITPDMIRQVKSHSQVCPIKIKEGKAELGENCQVPYIFHPFKCVLDELDLPDMEFVINGVDQPRVLKHHCNKTQIKWTDDCFCLEGYDKPNHGMFLWPGWWQPLTTLLPLFSFGTISACFYDIIIPSVFHITQAEVVVPDIPWQQKEFKAFWRGGSTGGKYDEDVHFSKFHRHRLVELCQHLEDCDAMFSTYERGEKMINMMREYYGPEQYTTLRRQAKYKILIDIDGYTYSQRFTQLLKLGAAVVKIKVFEDVGSIAAEPWVHYLPVDISLNDFEQQLSWAKANDHKLQKMAQRGRDLAKAAFHLKTYKCYIKTVLHKYHKLLRPDPIQTQSK